MDLYSLTPHEVYFNICIHFLKAHNKGRLTNEPFLFWAGNIAERIFPHLSGFEKLTLVFIQDQHKHLN